jgi:HSP20 family protein
MTLVRYNNEIPSLISNLINGDIENFGLTNFSDTNTTLPAVNIKESTEGFEVEVAAPGFKKSDFNIELDGDVLTISSEKRIENEVKEDEKFTKREFSYQSFTRSFTLPEMVESEKITAKYDNGILRIGIPKKEEAKPKPVKQIAVK